MDQTTAHIQNMADCERAVRDWAGDFSAAFVAVNRLTETIRDRPDCAGPRTVEALAGVLGRPDHLRQTHGQRLYQCAARGLVAVMTGNADMDLADHARRIMHRTLRSDSGLMLKGVSAALGNLPLSLRGPDIAPPPGRLPSRAVDVNSLAAGPWRRFGRSLVSPAAKRGRVLAVKLAGTADAAGLIDHEAHWMTWLRDHRHRFPDRFDLPKPLVTDGGYLFRPRGLPSAVPMTSSPAAIAFEVSADYFAYPNGQCGGRPMTPNAFLEVLGRCARLAGTLTAMGILHTALIPLFHNRMQQARRDDRGLYQWQRGGRLDRWLDSSRYPNFGLSGIRDFEHFSPCRPNDPRVYNMIGSHLIAFVLVAGSYFRGRDPERVGVCRDGNPVDVRHLFDRSLFADMLASIFRNYFRGVAHRDPGTDVPGMGDALVDRLIEEMGVDRHMTEMLRVCDQQAMTETAFARLLTSDRVAGPSRSAVRGAADIEILTGPHLGAFNSVISVPELIEFAAAGAAACIEGLYWRDRVNGTFS